MQLNFQTHNDPELIGMLNAATEFTAAMKLRTNPHWLSLVGKSGTGKTHLAKGLRAYAEFSQLRNHPTLTNGVRFVYWPKALDAIRGGDYGLADTIAQLNFVVLDDIGAERDPSGFAADKLSRILGERANKWTVITSNLSLAEIGERIDVRVVSRLIRGSNVVVESNAMDYALRSIH